MSTKRKWGILVYMAADNDLSRDAIYEIGQVCRTFEEFGEKLGDVEFFLYYDGDAFGFPSLSFDFQQSGGEPFEHKREYRTSPDSIYRFAESWKKKGRLAEITDFALIISSHGFGFQEASLMKDNSPGTSATVKDLGSNIRGLNEHQLDGKLRILGFDSCVMGELEVAFEMLNDDGTGNFDYQVSSEGYVPNANWGYSQILKNIALANGADIDPRQMAKIFVDSYIQEYGLSERYGGEAFDISAMKMEAVANLAGLVNELGGQLYKALEKKETQRELERLILGAHANSQTFLFDQCIDIKDFCEQLSVEISSSAYSSAFSKISEAIEPIVEVINPDNFYSRSLGAESQWATGVSLYFPWSYFSFLFTEEKYRSLRFGHKDSDGKDLCSWGDFMLQYLFQTMRDYRYNPATATNVRGLRGSGWKNFHNSNWFTVGTEGLIGMEGNKVDPRVKDKVDPMVKDKINPPVDAKLGTRYVENFRRTLNFPWLPEPAIDRLTSKRHTAHRDQLRSVIRGTNKEDPAAE